MHDAVAREGGAGEGNRPHIAVRDQRLACFLAVAVHDVEHTCRHARLERELAQACGREGRELAHLEHGGVAKGQAGRDLPGGRHERHVPRADERAHADRVEQRVVQVRGRRVGVTVHAGAHLGKVMEVVGRTRHQLLAGLADGLAAVLGLGFRNFRHVFRDQLAQFAHDFGALCGRCGGPFRERFFGCGNGSIDLRHAA